MSLVIQVRHGQDGASTTHTSSLIDRSARWCSRSLRSTRRKFRVESIGIFWTTVRRATASQGLAWSGEIPLDGLKWQYSFPSRELMRTSQSVPHSRCSLYSQVCALNYIAVSDMVKVYSINCQRKRNMTVAWVLGSIEHSHKFSHSHKLMYSVEIWTLPGAPLVHLQWVNCCDLCLRLVYQPQSECLSGCRSNGILLCAIRKWAHLRFLSRSLSVMPAAYISSYEGGRGPYRSRIVHVGAPLLMLSSCS